MIRVLLVDDSPIALVVLERLLAEAPDIQVVGTARHGLDALEKIPKLKPDVICTDLHMPHMNGMQFIREVIARHPLPILVISVSVQKGDDENIFDLLEAGAIDVFPKPRAGLEAANAALGRELCSKVRILSGVVAIRRHRHTGAREAQPRAVAETTMPTLGALGMVAIGASTGGPQALMAILSRLPGDYPAPILCVQHISSGFLQELVDWLDHHTPLSVRVLDYGQAPERGHVYLPPEEAHLGFDAQGRFMALTGVEDRFHCPSIDLAFQSVARAYGRRGAGVLLTGMGRDGADGLLAMRQAGGVTMAQDEESCVVFGMPKQAIDQGAAQHVLPLERIAPALLHLVGRVEPPSLSG